jgi:hypothetical protein
MTTFNNATLRDWLDIYEKPQKFPEIEATSDEYAHLHEIDTRTKSDDVLNGLKDYPFAGACTVRADEEGDVVVEVYHHFFKLLPNGVEFDSQIENMFCIKGISHVDYPKVVEFPSEFVDTMSENSEKTPSLIDFMEVAVEKQTIGDLKAPEDFEKACEEADLMHHPNPEVSPRKMLGIIPPFLMKCFGNKAGKPHSILTSVISEIDKYSTEYLDDNGILAMWGAFYPLLQRLWLASTYDHTEKSHDCPFFLSVSLPTTFDERALKVGIETEDKYQIRFTTGESGTQRTLGDVQLDQSIQAAISKRYDPIIESNADFQAKLISMTLDKSDKEKTGKGWKRLNDHNKQYILFAGASVERKVATGPNEEFSKFLDLKKDQALPFLQSSIITQRGGSQVIDMAINAWLWNGTLYNANHHGAPIGLSIFYAVPAPLIGGEHAMSQDEFNIRKDCNNLSLAEIKAAMQSQVQIPKDDNEFKATMENFLCIVDFVLGKTSFVYAQLDGLLNTINKNKGAFKAVTTQNDRFIASLMQAIDIKSQLFFKSCAAEQTLDKVNFDHLNFADEVNCILTHKSIGISLPLVVLQALKDGIPDHKAAKNGKRPPNAAEHHEEPTPKRKAQASAKNASPVKASWIKKGENFSIFQAQMKSVPTLKGKEICAKYHVMGVCKFGEGCQRSRTHTNDWDEATIAAFDAWVNKCRQMAGK